MEDKQSIRAVVRRIFAGGLPDALGGRYEKRAGQLEMALQAATAFEEGRTAVIEAGTGLGKSLAYLIPLLERCRSGGSRAVVSTHTRNLQQQLISKDFPAARKAAASSLEARVLMGRANYACKAALNSVQKERHHDREALQHVLDWLAQDESGVIERIPRLRDSLRKDISCPRRESVCTGCRLRSECYLFRARKEAADSPIVFVNHALLFANIATNGALLGPYDLLVIDEAHHLPDVATEFLSVSFSPRSIKGSPQALFSNAYEDSAAYLKALLAGRGSSDGTAFGNLCDGFHDAVNATHSASQRFFAALDRNVAAHRGGMARSERKPTSIPYREGSGLLYGLDDEVSVLRDEFSLLVRTAAEIADGVVGMPGLADGGVEGSLGALSAAAREAFEEFDFLVTGDDEDYVFYVDTAEDGGVRSLCASPIDVSGQLGPLLDKVGRGTVLTSATLAVGGDFSYTLKRLGLDRSRSVEATLFESPFDFSTQRTVLLASYLSGPSDARFITESAATIGAVAKSTDRNMLVLCTAREQLRRLVEVLSTIEGIDDRILSQDPGASRPALVEEFRRRRGAILVGLASFWEGVDFPGDVLEILVIVKTPFLVPTAPVVQARADLLRRTGEDPFLTFFLPDAALKLKQGFGRLIRTGSDRGAVILLDSRLADRAYGEVLLGAVTDSVTMCPDVSGLLDRVNAAVNR